MNRSDRQRRWEDQFPQQKRHMRKGMYILPSIFTAANIGAGYYAIVMTFLGGKNDFKHFDYAAIAIGVAVLADGLDGRIARMTSTTSDFGRELDSLADVITFGVAPAILGWMWGFQMLEDFPNPDLHAKFIRLGMIATFVFLVCGASRLARFNITSNPQPSNPGRPGRKYFVGLPIPAGAGVLASVVHFFGGQPISYWWLASLWFVLLIVVGLLMVSNWRFYSFKELNLGRRHPFQTLVMLCAIVALIGFFSQLVLLLMAMTYMLSGIFTRLAYTLRRWRAARQSYEEAPESQ